DPLEPVRSCPPCQLIVPLFVIVCWLKSWRPVVVMASVPLAAIVAVTALFQLPPDQLDAPVRVTSLLSTPPLWFSAGVLSVAGPHLVLIAPFLVGGTDKFSVLAALLLCVPVGALVKVELVPP